MDNTVALYFEVDGLSVDRATGETCPAGLAIHGFDPETVAQLTPEAAVALIAEITGFEPDCIHPISAETYSERYGN